MLVIPVLLHLGSQYEYRIPKWFTKIGRSTLAIYVFHYFLLPNVLLATYLGKNLSHNLIIYLVVSAFIAIPIIMICMLIEKVINANRYLKKLIWFQETKS